MTEAGLIRVLLAEDNSIVSYTVRKLLEQFPNIEVVGEARNGEEAVMKAEHLQPTIVVMDINMPKLDGIAATRLIKANFPRIAVIGLSVNAEGYHQNALLQAGAYEVLSKDKAGHELYAAIQRAVASLHPILIAEDPSSAEQSTSELHEADKNNQENKT
jgi:DNA-binding NarL/FixJ family response regulator